MSETFRELASLLDIICNEQTLSAEQSVRLKQILQGSDAACEFYHHYMDVHLITTDLVEKGAACNFENSIGERNFESEPMNDRSKTGCSLDIAPGLELDLEQSHQTQERQTTTREELGVSKAYGGSRSRLLYSIAAVLACSLLLCLYMVSSNSSHVTQIQKKDADIAKKNTAKPGERFEVPRRYVAQIASMSKDVAWREQSPSREFLLRVRAEERFELQAGLVQLDYFSGASLILHGPCVFIATGYDSGRLESGSVTGRVTIGDFKLSTPSANVIDLGTEFGATVDSSNNTDVYVFDGKVELTSVSGRVNQSQESILLTNGMAARASAEGVVDGDVQVDHSGFIRAMPMLPSLHETGRLSLVDVISGYREGNYRLAGGIEPHTGNAYRQESLARELGDSAGNQSVYHVTSWHPFVDGVFIPSKSGQRVRTDSTGRLVTLPECTAITWGPIWSRRRLEKSTKITMEEFFWSELSGRLVQKRLSSSEWGMVGIHANAGITIDLHAVCESTKRQLSGFEAVVANLDSSHYVANPNEVSKVDFRLFVDGELRKSRLDFGLDDGEMSISTTIKPEDRFLTFVTNDAGNFYCDQVVLIDPFFAVSQSDTSPDALLKSWRRATNAASNWVAKPVKTTPTSNFALGSMLTLSELAEVN